AQTCTPPRLQSSHAAWVCRVAKRPIHCVAGWEARGPGSTRPRGRRGCIGGCRADDHELEARTVTSVDAADPTASTAPTPRPSAFAVFRKRDFTLLWLAQFVSTAGSALTDLAAGILVFQLTNSALAVGLTLMATAVPSLVVGLLAGVF